MGGGGHGHEAPYEIPNYKIYKVEDVPKLLATKRSLAEMGLKDPWLRNEVWRYGTMSTKDILTKGMFRGFKYGLVAALITSAITYAIEANEDHGHGHGKH